PDASGLFLADRRPDVSGSVVVPTIDGHRPLLVEVQGLVVPTPFPAPRRSAQGIDAGRLPMLLAVLARRAGIELSKHDVYALAVGGVRVSDPGGDLGIALALASSLTDRPVPASTVAFGEIGLGGELRQVSQCTRRLTEAVRLGYRRAVVPALSPPEPEGIEVVRAATLREALRAVAIAGSPARADG
ncbi:MAG TPA: magnesium chelatase domain-containing protein, partial [Acidimicrobiales bacterium]|nr:magnesium chelatase domain-containing protein [Acidimicrobiales bacterium]